MTAARARLRLRRRGGAIAATRRAARRLLTFGLESLQVFPANDVVPPEPSSRQVAAINVTPESLTAHTEHLGSLGDQDHVFHASKRTNLLTTVKAYHSCVLCGSMVQCNRGQQLVGRYAWPFLTPADTPSSAIGSGITRSSTSRRRRAHSRQSEITQMATPMAVARVAKRLGGSRARFWTDGTRRAVLSVAARSRSSREMSRVGSRQVPRLRGRVRPVR